MGQPIELTFALTNLSTQSIKLLPWNTPLEGWFNRYLKVTRDGMPTRYQGAMVKRFAPGPDDFIAMAGQQTQQATVDLAQGYDMSAPGQYEIEFSGYVSYLIVSDKDEQNKMFKPDCGKLQIEVKP